MNLVFNSEPSVTVRGIRQEEDFTYTVVETPAISSGVASAVDVDDVTVERTVGITSTNNFRLEVSDSILRSGHTFLNDTPSIVSVDANGNVTRLVNGLASVSIETPVGTRKYEREMVDSGAGTVDVFQNFRTGSLGKHVVDAMLALISGKTPSDTTRNRFSSNNYNTAAPAVTLNTSCFAASLDLSPISVINTASGVGTKAHPGLLIGSRHIVSVAHYPTVGPIVFMRADGTLQTVALNGIQQISGTDIVVGHLAEDITGCAPFKLLPGNFRNYIPSAASGLHVDLPAISRDTRNASGNSMDQLGITIVQYASAGLGGTLLYYGSPDNEVPSSAAHSWFVGQTGGVSGSPVFVPVGSDLVLLTAYTGAGYGYVLSDYITQINTLMNSLATLYGDASAGGYEVSTANLSGFTNYA